MLLIVLALFWIAILIPIAIRHFRENGTERSIESFHAEHDVLSRQEYTVAPAHRLDQPDDDYREPAGYRPRLTVVHADDTYGSLESRSTWEEWAEDYDYDDERGATPRYETQNRYVAAYSTTPHAREITHYGQPIEPYVSMRLRRTRIFLGLLVGAVLFTMLSFLVNSAIVQDIALLLWLGMAAFIAAALLSVSQGFLHESSLPLRRSNSRALASVEPLYPAGYAAYDDEFYNGDDEGRWRRESASRYALG